VWEFVGQKLLDLIVGMIAVARQYIVEAGAEGTERDKT